MNSIELFAGAGGLGLGARAAGFHPLKVVEWDNYCVETIKENQRRRFAGVKGWPIAHGDVRDVSFNDFEGEVTLVSGGPPCQPFSMGGKHGAHRDHRDMWAEAVRAVRETRPKAFIFENVKGLTREKFATYVSYIQLQMEYPSIERGGDEDWADHLSRLERHHTSGRNAQEYRVVMRLRNAADYGVPQKRERVFFVGFRADLGIEWSFPEKTHSLDALIWDQFGTGAYWERNKVAKKDRPVNERFAARAKVLARTFGGVPEGAGQKAWRTVRQALEGLPDPEHDPVASLQLLNHKFQSGARSYPGHTGSPLDEPAKTLKAGVHGVPGGENMLLRADGSVRYFTVRESARLQTFPDKYKFHGSWTETMRQLGNAVPVELAAVVAKDVASRMEPTW
jgi:DNA (cytosine-5)-methyltransferase 1